LPNEGALKAGIRGFAAVRDQLLGRDPIDVEVVDECDVAAGEMFDQQLCPPAEPHRAADGPHGAQLRRKCDRRGRRGRRGRGRILRGRG